MPTFIVTNPVSIVHDVHLAHDTFLVDELDAAKFAGVVGTQLFELVERVIIAINLQNEFRVQIFPVADVMDWIGIDLNPRVFSGIAKVMWNSVLDFPSTTFAVVQMLSYFGIFMDDAVLEVVLQADLCMTRRAVKIWYCTGYDPSLPVNLAKGLLKRD